MLGATAILMALNAHASCEWKSPGQDPFMGSVPAAIETYTDIPPEVRAKLRARMERREYDDVALITRDTVQGASEYGGELRGMHFGSKGKVCPVVTRASWTPDMKERGLVYCEAQTCIIVPTVCRNVARIERFTPPVVPAHLPDAENAPTAPPVPSAGEVLAPVAPTVEPPATFESQSAPPPWGYPYPVPTGGSGGGTWCEACCLPVTTPVPELATWVSLMAGLALLLAFKRKPP